LLLGLVLSMPASLLVPSEPEGEVLLPTLVLGEVLVDEPVVAELSVDVPVVGLPLTPVFGLVLVPVFGVVLVPVPVVDPVVPVVDPLTPLWPLAVPLWPARVSSPVVPGIPVDGVPVAPVALPVPVPDPAGLVDVPALVPPVPPTDPEPVPPPVCAATPAAARAPAARTVTAYLLIRITFLLEDSTVRTAATGVNPRNVLKPVPISLYRSVARPLVLRGPTHLHAEVLRGLERPIGIAEQLPGDEDGVRLP
jgi:hypothetical protein